MAKQIARKLREHPDLEQLKRQAKELLQAFLAEDAYAIAEVSAHYRGADPGSFALHDAQLVLARSYGFESWPKLKAYVDGVTVQRLADAVRRGDLEQTQSMLRTRPELANMTISYGDEHRPLHFAVMNRSAEMVRLLMRSGADARRGIHPHRDATAALTIAVERGYDEIVATIRDEEERRTQEAEATSATPMSTRDELLDAMVQGDAARITAILEREPLVLRARDQEGWTPLEWAASKRVPVERFPAVAAILRRAGAELTPRAAVALGEAVWLRTRHAEGILFNPVSWDVGGLLTVAVRHNRTDILSLLLDFGFDPDERIPSGEGPQVVYSQAYPLWHAAALGRKEAAEILLQRGANPNVHVDSSGSPVHSAYSHRQWEMVALLRRYGGAVGADTAAIYRETELVRQMIAQDEGGTLPPGAVSPGRTLAEDLLDFGSSGGDPETVRMALERIDWPPDDSRWFRFLVRSLDFWNHIPWLYAANSELDRGTYFACFAQVLRRCDPDLIGAFGRTALHEVAAMGDHVTEEEAAPFARALLHAGARTDLRDDILKSTALGWACRWGRAEVARVLLQHGADPVEADGEPWSRPRAWAEKMGHERVLAVLREHGG